MMLLSLEPWPCQNCFNFPIVGENGHAFFNCDLHGVLKFSQVVGVVPWYLPLRFGRGAEVSPRWNLWGVAFLPGITNIFKKIASLTILDGFESSIHLWIGNDVYNFTKIAAILNFHVNMPPSWILLCFWTFFNKIIFPLRVHHCTIYVIYYDAAYTAEVTIY